MFGFAKHCPVCGVDVKKESSVKRFGEYLCSKEHALQYVQRRTEEEKLKEEERRHNSERSGGGCC